MNSNLPLPKFVSSLYPEVSFDNTLVIACQHLLGTTYSMFEELFAKGLKPKNLYILGKCYSTNEEVFQRFINKGVKVSQYSKSFDSHISFDEQFQECVNRFLKEVGDISKFGNWGQVPLIS